MEGSFDECEWSLWFVLEHKWCQPEMDKKDMDSVSFTDMKWKARMKMMQQCE